MQKKKKKKNLKQNNNNKIKVKCHKMDEIDTAISEFMAIAAAGWFAIIDALS